MRSILLNCCLVGLLALLSGCASTPPKDYTAFREYAPKSILVLPPANQSVDPEASYAYLSTVTLPLAERGFYVYPVAVIDAFMKENGIPTPAEMHQVPLEKFDEIIGPDAILYIVIEKYGTSYQILNSATTVSVTARLVDVETGTELWSGSEFTVDSTGGGGGLFEMMIAAAVDQIISTTTDEAYRVARINSGSLVFRPDQGLLPGPYAPAEPQ